MIQTTMLMIIITMIIIIITIIITFNLMMTFRLPTSIGRWCFRTKVGCTFLSTARKPVR